MAEIKNILNLDVAKLSLNQISVLYLIHNGLKLIEISKLTGINYNTVKSINKKLENIKCPRISNTDLEIIEILIRYLKENDKLHD